MGSPSEFLTEGFKSFLMHSFSMNLEKLKKEFKKAKPFPHLVLKNLFKDIEIVKEALLNEPFAEQNSDLFQFQQTDDISKSKNLILREFHKRFSSKEFLKLISEITGKKLNSIDMSGFIYDDTDYLLPHDDRLEGRKIAYIVQLSTLKASDGGRLQFFKDKKIVKSIVPQENTLVIFEVSDKSLHQVEEVKTNAKRISFAGWFHG